jgi:hypothetical protein
MARTKLLGSAMGVVALCCFMVGTSAAKVVNNRCEFKGDYSFYFYDTAFGITGTGYFGANCSGRVTPGGIINCNVDGVEYEDFIEDGGVFVETDGEGTMEIETNSSRGICGTGLHALELDVSVVLAGKTVLFNSDTEPYAASGVIPQAGYFFNITGRADKCFAGQIAGCYDLRFWSPLSILSTAPIETDVGDCTVCVDGRGGVTQGECRCSSQIVGGSRLETLSEITGGGYTLGDGCESSTGYLWFTTASDDICGIGPSLALDFAVAQTGKEIVGQCNAAEFILNNSSIFNTGFVMPCSFEGWLH